MATKAALKMALLLRIAFENVLDDYQINHGYGTASRQAVAYRLARTALRILRKELKSTESL